MMKIGTLAALPLALLASQALAHNWVKVGTDENEIPRYVDKDSIHRGDYNLVYFIDYYEPLDGPDGEDMAVDCPKRLIYLLNFKLDGNGFNWHDHGDSVDPGTVGEAMLKYVCANAR